ncbi:MAG TPA: TIGR00266 family protein [Caldisericia bacterium]|nr:TIGR00266 family protein [Caldisericia bacterium]HPF48198.1 TIGR00266 family protein [Caldisericia bacterium]HPI83866.1 TIGR00266 family protein [Caldisericia bacterium]HPQ92651.1 TIGR00266 family protein [Caldisericia bacterium]HRV74251.1 TIGR00266 family protein [Caldisericia bacterium]
MEFDVLGGQLPTVVCKMKQNEKMISESGGMCWMTAGMKMETGMKGGLMGAFKRSMAGESAFVNTFTSTNPEDEIAFSSSFPGQIIHFNLAEGQHVIAQKGAFLAGSDTLSLEIHFRKKLWAGLMGGEGFILNKIQGPGDAFLEIDGALVMKELADGEVLKVDTGHVAILEPTVNFDVEMVKGFKNIFMGGEGLFLAVLRGPGKVWLQSMNVQELANQLRPFMPGK